MNLFWWVSFWCLILRLIFFSVFLFCIKRLIELHFALLLHDERLMNVCLILRFTKKRICFCLKNVLTNWDYYWASMIVWVENFGIYCLRCWHNNSQVAWWDIEKIPTSHFISMNSSPHSKKTSWRNIKNSNSIFIFNSSTFVYLTEHLSFPFNLSHSHAIPSHSQQHESQSTSIMEMWIIKNAHRIPKKIALLFLSSLSSFCGTEREWWNKTSLRSISESTHKRVLVDVMSSVE